MYFSLSHFWVKQIEDAYYLGLTDFMQKELGEIVHIELPKVGSSFNEGEVFAVVESTKAATDLPAPAQLKVLQLNPVLEQNPELINDSAQDQGWLVKISLSDESLIIENWMSESDYSQQILQV